MKFNFDNRPVIELEDEDLDTEEGLQNLFKELIGMTQRNMSYDSIEDAFNKALEHWRSNNRDLG